MQAAADQLVKLFRRECEMRVALAAMWPWTPNDCGAIGLNGIAVKERLMWYLYKIGAVLNFGGGATFDTMPVLSRRHIPEARRSTPAEKIPSMVDVMAEKSAYAANVLDAGTFTTIPPLQCSAN